VFTEGGGTSAAIARTRRGHSILQAAAADGVIVLQPLRLDLVARIQPLQVQRRSTVPGRLIGRTLALRRVPTYRRYGMLRILARAPIANARAAVGAFLRSVREKS
jgi:coenzyme F420 hydrogenase subunit beta